MKYIGDLYRSILKKKKIRSLLRPFIINYNIVNKREIDNEFFEWFIDKYGLMVIDGPFKGLRYPATKSVGSALIPKLVGTYEQELHHILFKLKRNKDYQQIIDIGAAEGYYAVGLSLLFNNLKTIAFESSETGQELIRQMSLLNNTKNIEIMGECTVLNLNDILKPINGFIFCDCEGYEIELLDLEKLPYLKHYDLLVELHDFSDYGATIMEDFLNRFAKTHAVTFINMRYKKRIKELSKNITNDRFDVLFNEGRRFSIGWSFLESKFK